MATAIVVAGCGAGQQDGVERASESAPPPVAGVGNRGMAVELRRFQAESPEAPSRFAGGAASRDALIAAWIAAVERADTVGLQSLRVTRSEFAHVFFPASIFMAPPYELDPAIVWMQVDAESEKAVGRTMRAYGGRPLHAIEPVCASEPQEHGPARLWGCDIRRTPAGGAPAVERLFGAILEHEGRFKFLSLGNRL